MKKNAQIVYDEVLAQPGLNATLHSFMKQIIRDGQAIEAALGKQLEYLEKHVEGGQHVTREDTLSAMKAFLFENYGRDQLTKAIAVALVTGEGIY